MSAQVVLLGAAAGGVAACSIRQAGVAMRSGSRPDAIDERRPKGPANRLRGAQIGTSQPRRPLPTRGVLVTVLLVVALVVGVKAACAAAALGAAGRVIEQRRAERRRGAERDAAVPDLVDLFALAAAAGLPVATAVPVVADRSPPALRPAMTAASARMARGGSVSEAFEGLRRPLGPRAGPLLDALDAAARTGTPLRPALAAVAAAAHHQRARAAEEAARRLPVTLLFPLACCTLPAAVLLALVPVLVVSLGSLSG